MSLCIGMVVVDKCVEKLCCGWFSVHGEKLEELEMEKGPFVGKENSLCLSAKDVCAELI